MYTENKNLSQCLSQNTEASNDPHLMQVTDERRGTCLITAVV